MDQYPYLSDWLNKTARSEAALMNLIILVCLCAGLYTLALRRWSEQGERVTVWAVRLACAICILVMVALR